MSSGSQRFPIGATSMMFWYATVEEAIPIAAGMGYDVMEIWAEHLWRGEEDPRQINHALKREGLSCTVHCPIMDVNITSPNRGIQAESLRQMLEAIELGHNLEAELLVVHPGQLFSKHDSISEYWAVQLQAFERMMAHAQKHSVRLAVENMDVQSNAEVVKSSQDIRRITSHFADGELGVVLDTTHLGSTKLVVDFIAQSDGIIHTHLSDARRDQAGKVQLHLPLGEGELDFTQILSTLLPHYQGILSLETFIAPGNPDKVVAQRSKLQTIVRSLDKGVNDELSA